LAIGYGFYNSFISSLPETIIIYHYLSLLSHSSISSFDFKAPVGASELPLSQQTNRRTSASQMVISHRKDGATDDFWADMLKFLVHKFFLIFLFKICGGDVDHPRKFHLYM